MAQLVFLRKIREAKEAGQPTEELERELEKIYDPLVVSAGELAELPAMTEEELKVELRSLDGLVNNSPLPSGSTSAVIDN